MNNFRKLASRNNRIQRMHKNFFRQQPKFIIRHSPLTIRYSLFLAKPIVT